MKVERSRHVVLVMPPDVRRAGRVWETHGLAPGVRPASLVVVVCADYEQAAQWAELAPAEYRAHALTGLARTGALLKEGRVGLLAGAPADLAALVAKSALKLDTIETIVIAWPEGFAGELDALLAEVPEARRVVLSWNPPALGDFLERHARRAEIVGDLPLDPDGKALPPVCSARYVVVSAARRAAAVREALDTLRAARPYVWTGGVVEAPAGVDAVVCATLPTRAEMQALAAIGQPTVLAIASQLAYLKSIAALTPLALPSSVDRAQDRAEALRARIADRLERGEVDAELAVLQPLFEDHDPALIAGAILALQREQGAGSGEQPTAEPPASGAARVKVFVNVGKQDGAGAKDLVGALIREVGLDKAQIGKIDVKETFSLVEVAPAIAEQAVRRLTGVVIRGKRVTARVDRAG